MEHSVLLGNGLNYFSKNHIDWKDLLKRIAEQNLNKVSSKDKPTERIPYTLQYENIYLSMDIKPVKGNEYKGTTEYELKQRIANELSDCVSNDIYKMLLQLPINNFMTTNYDHAMYITYQECGFWKDEDKSDITESIYNIRRHQCLVNSTSTEEKIIWQIHGDIEATRSIMLGYDHYCGQLAKMKAYIDGNYKINSKKNADNSVKAESRIVEAIINRLPIYNFEKLDSWIDLFFATNVHILGLGLYFDEIDLWWLLNKRMRLLKEKKTPISNNIHFYHCYTEKNNDRMDDERKSLLETFGVKIHEFYGKSEYFSLYERAIKEIEKNIVRE